MPLDFELVQQALADRPLRDLVQSFGVREQAGEVVDLEFLGAERPELGQ